MGRPAGPRRAGRRDVAETIEDTDRPARWSSLGLLAVATIGTVFGMTVLALAVTVEELDREARSGRPDISFGNVAGSILAFPVQR